MESKWGLWERGLNNCIYSGIRLANCYIVSVSPLKQHLWIQSCCVIFESFLCNNNNNEVDPSKHHISVLSVLGLGDLCMDIVMIYPVNISHNMNWGSTHIGLPFIFILVMSPFWVKERERKTN
jgi:hypothetical protein